MITGVAGCVRYTAPVRQDYERGDFAVHVESVNGRRLGEAHVVLQARRVPNGATLVHAAVSAKPVGCEDGIYAMRLGRDRAAAADAPLAEGERMTLTFPNGVLSTFTESRAYLELLVRAQNGTLRCLSLPLAEPDAPLDFEARERFTFGADISIEGFTSEIGPVSQMVLLPAAMGVWIGQVHVDLGGGFAFAGCPEAHCARPAEDQRINYATGLLGFAGAGMSLYEKGEVALGVSLRYRVFTLPADTREGRVEQTAHGPVVAPFVAGVGLPAGPSDEMKGSRQGLIGLEIPVGYAVIDTAESAVTIGGNLRVFFTVL